MLCIMGSNTGSAFGQLKVNGQVMPLSALSRLAGAHVNTVRGLVKELENNGVFSRTRDGTIYCRRMIRQQKNRENGKLGGNPNLLKTHILQDPVNQEPKPLYPLPLPSKKESKKEANGHASGWVGEKRKPRHGQKTKDGTRVWLNRNTPEWTQYAEAFAERHNGMCPPTQWNGSGTWFNIITGDA